MKIIKSALVALGIFILGFIIVGVLSSNKGTDVKLSYYAGIIYGILFFTAVIAFFLSLILSEIRKFHK
ncbi:hypothetical protein V7148_22105 [Gottfriedia acidiceleris]|uniref:hypothetical protein n=1 Tax=Gottfriedia acidiceleris TaxID=371036 RepID=UPI0030009338